MLQITSTTPSSVVHLMLLRLRSSGESWFEFLGSLGSRVGRGHQTDDLTSADQVAPLLTDWYQIAFLGQQQATVHWVTRVGHDLATKPPPPQKLIKSQFGDRGLGISNFIWGPLACFEQKSPAGPTYVLCPFWHPSTLPSDP